MASKPILPSPSDRKIGSVRAVKRSGKSGQFKTAGFSKDSRLPPGILASTRLKKAGGSLVATVPAAARNMLRLTEGQEMAVTVEDGKLTLEPMPNAAPQTARHPRYTLDELVAQCDPTGAVSDDEKAWQEAPAVGREVW